jgi:hypothetical protein
LSETGKHKWFATVYESVSGTEEYPPQGSKLNNPSVVTFHGVYCKSRKPEKLEAYPDKLAASVQSVGGQFLNYEPKKGTLSFRVPHWSRYEIQEDSDSDSEFENEELRSPMNSRRPQPKVSQSTTSRVSNRDNVDMMMSSSSSDEDDDNDNRGSKNNNNNNLSRLNRSGASTSGIVNTTRLGGGGFEAHTPRGESPPQSPWPPQTPQGGFTSPFSQPLSNLSAKFYGSAGFDQPSPFQSPFAKSRPFNMQPPTTTQQTDELDHYEERKSSHVNHNNNNNNILALVPHSPRNEIFRHDDEVLDEEEEEQLMDQVQVQDQVPHWYPNPLGMPPKEEVDLPQVPRFYRMNVTRNTPIYIYIFQHTTDFHFN